MLQSMGLQRVRHEWATEQQQQILIKACYLLVLKIRSPTQVSLGWTQEVGRAAFLLEAPGKVSLLDFSSFSRLLCPRPGLLGPPLHRQSQQQWVGPVSYHCPHPWLSLLSFPSTFMNSCKILLCPPGKSRIISQFWGPFISSLNPMHALALHCVQLLVPHGPQHPARLLCPWNFPGKNIGVGCHFLLQGIFPAQG